MTTKNSRVYDDEYDDIDINDDDDDYKTVKKQQQKFSFPHFRVKPNMSQF